MKKGCQLERADYFKLSSKYYKRKARMHNFNKNSQAHNALQKIPPT